MCHTMDLIITGLVSMYLHISCITRDASNWVSDASDNYQVQTKIINWCFQYGHYSFTHLLQNIFKVEIHKCLLKIEGDILNCWTNTRHVCICLNVSFMLNTNIRMNTWISKKKVLAKFDLLHCLPSTPALNTPMERIDYFHISQNACWLEANIWVLMTYTVTDQCWHWTYFTFATDSWAETCSIIKKASFFCKTDYVSG